MGQGHFNEYQRFVRQRWMKKGEAAPVTAEPPPQIVPTVDLMHRFVFDYFLEDERRRLPIDSLQRQEPAVEPGSQQMLKDRIQRLELGMGRQ